MRKVFYLSTCTTCKKILDQLPEGHGLDLQDIKSESIQPEQLEEMHKRAGSYEKLFSRRSMKYRKWGLHEETLTEDRYRDLILEEYTFLKRPVFVIDDEIFIGNAKKEVEGALAVL